MMFGTFKNFKKWSLAASFMGITAFPSFAQTVPQNGLSLWLKQDAGVATDGNGNVTSWTDQSSSQIQLTVTGGQAPTVSTTGLNFENGAVLANLDAQLPVGDVTIITVAAKDSPQNDGALVLVGNGAGGARGLVYSGGGFLDFVDDGGTYPNETAQGGPVFPKPQNLALNAITFNQSTGVSQFYIQGASNPFPASVNLTNATTVGTSVSVGAANPGGFDSWSGTISEVLVYNRILQPSELARVTQYLSDKYGIYTSQATWPTTNSNYSSFVLNAISANQLSRTQANALTNETQTYPALPTNNLLNWFAADVTSSLSSSGGSVNSWTDLITGNPLMPTGSSAPTYLSQDVTGKPSVSFNPVNGNQTLFGNLSLGASYNGDMTIITLANTSDYSNTESSFSLGQFATGQLRSMAYQSGDEFFIGFADDLYGGQGPALNTYTVESTVVNTSTANPPQISFYQNGTATVSNVPESSALNSPVSGMSIGSLTSGDAPWSGNIAEVLVYQGQLTPAQIAVVNNYLVAKYGLSNLPVVPAPVIAPNTATIDSSTPVNISDAISYATIYYTLDGTDPTTLSQAYSQPFTVTAPVTVKAIAVVNGTSSQETTQNYISAQYAPIAGVIQENNLNATQAAALLVEQQNNQDVVTNGLLDWFAADSLPTNSTAIASWTDLASGNIVNQSSTANQPSYVLAATDIPASVSFNGTQNLSSSAAFSSHYNGDLTIVTVANTNSSSTTGPEYAFGLGQNANTQMRASGYFNSNEYFSGSGDDAAGGPAPSNGNFTVEAVTLNQSAKQASFYQNGNTTVSTTLPTALTSPTGGISIGSLIGATAGWNGNIAEVLVFDHILSLAEMQQINLYLGNKYGLYTVNVASSATNPIWYSAAKYVPILSQIQASGWTQSQADNFLNTGVTVSGLVVSLDPTGLSGSKWTDSVGQHVFTASGTAPVVITDPLLGQKAVQFTSSGSFSCPDQIDPNQNLTVITVNDCDLSQTGTLWNVGGRPLRVGSIQTSPGDDFSGSPATTAPYCIYYGQTVFGQGLYTLPNNLTGRYSVDATQISPSNGNDQVNIYRNGSLLTEYALEFPFQPPDVSNSVSQATLSSGMTIGGLTGTIAKMLVFNRTLSNLEIQQVEGQLADQYGLVEPNASWQTKAPYSAYPDVALNHFTRVQADSYIAFQNQQSNVISSGLISWFSADDLATGAVGSWTDRVIGTKVSQSTASLQPTLTKNSFTGTSSIQFTGTQYLSSPVDLSPGTNASETFVTVTNSPISSNEYAVDIGQTGQDRAFGYTGSPNYGLNTFVNNEAFQFQNSNSVTTTSTGAAGITNEPVVEVCTVSPSINGTSTVVFYQNGVQTKSLTITTPNAATSGTTIGSLFAGQSGWNGGISELLVYDRALAASDVSSVSNYFIGKYGIYTPTAPWLAQYSKGIQAVIAANNWDSQQAAAFAATIQNGVDTDGLALWLKADSSSVTLADSLGHVSQWQESVGGMTTAFAASQSTTALQPIYQTDPQTGLSTVRFNGNQILQDSTDAIPAGKDITLIAVASDDYPSKSAYYYQVGDGTGPGQGRALAVQNGQLDFDTYYGGVDGGQAPVAGETAIQTITWSSAHGTLNYYIRGLLAGTSQTYNAGNLANGFVIGNAAGGPQPLTGSVSEIMVYNRVLTPAEVDLAELYLANKYNLYHQNFAGVPDSSWITNGNYPTNILALIEANHWNLKQTNNYIADQTAVVPSGLISWYKPDSGLSQDASGNVTWQDQGTGQNNLVPGTASPTIVFNALGGYSGVSFNGTNQNLVLDHFNNFSTGSQDRTVFLLTQYQGNGSGGLGYGSPTANSGFSLGIESNGATSVDNGNNPLTFGSSVTSNGFVLQEAELSNSSVSVYENGDSLGTNSTLSYTTNSAGTIVLGSNLAQTSFVNQTVCEALIYNRALSSTERKLVESYLLTKYNLEFGAAPVVFNPPGGTTVTLPSVSLSTLTNNSTIVYTTDGSTPTHSSTVYSGPIALTQTTTIQALAFSPGRADSPITSQTYTQDTHGPTLSNLQFGGVPLVAGATITGNTLFSVNATDPQTVTHVDFLIDGALIGTSNGPTTYSTNFNITNTPDGSHSFSVNAYNALGSLTTQTVTITVQQAPPAAPVLTSPVNGLISGASNVMVQGTSISGATVTLFINGKAQPNTVLAANDGTFQANVNLANNVNSIQASAVNSDGRGGAGPLSTALSVTLDTNVPIAPASFKTTTLAGGKIQLTWAALPSGTVTGYDIYRSTTPFTSPSQVFLLNSTPITASSYTDLPSTDGTYYYLVTAISPAGLQGTATTDSSGVSDRVPPEATSITYTPQGTNFDPTTGEFSPGLVKVVVNMSKPLQAPPLLSITPSGGVPISVALQANPSSNLQYTGVLAIQSNTPTGTANAIVSAIDVAGNIGNKIDSGSTVLFDTTGPTVTALMFNPSTAIQNNSTNPVQVDVTLTLDKPVQSGVTPTVGYTLSSNPSNQLTFSSIVAGSNNLTWIASTTLPSTAGANPEILALTFSAPDHLGNIGNHFAVPNQVQVYQGKLPGLAAPFGLTATPQPGGKIQLQWLAVAGASDYQIYRQGPGDSSLQPLAKTGGANSYLDSTNPNPTQTSNPTQNPPTDGTYTYTVATILSLNGQTSEGQQSGAVKALAQSETPPSPLALTASLQGYGVALSWQAPTNLSEQVTYSLYRSASVINSLGGLTPLQTNISSIQAVDSQPNSDQPYYAVAAVDAAGNVSLPSNQYYLNTSLLPVSTFTITQVSGTPPVLSWSPVSGNIAGYNLFLGPTSSLQPLNSSPLTTTSYTDNSYSGGEQQFTIVTVDSNNQPSVGRTLNLPVLSATLATSSVVKIGLINNLAYTVTNSSAETISNINLRVTLNGKNTEQSVSPVFSLAPGQSQQVTVVVGGYSDLPVGTSPINTAIEVTPHAGELVSLQQNSQIATLADSLQVAVLTSNFIKGGTGTVQFSLTNPSAEPVEVIVAQGNGSQASSQTRFVLEDASNNIYSTTPVQFNVGANTITLADGNTVLQIPAGATVTSPNIIIPVPSTCPDTGYVQFKADNVYFDEGQTDQVTLSGITTRQPVSLTTTTYFGTVTKVTPSLSNGTQPIVISGTATFRSNSSPAPNQPLTLYIAVNGFTLNYQIATDSNGNFSYTFTPPTGQSGGVYTTWADNPQLTDTTPQATFTTTQVSVSPVGYNLTGPKNYPQTLNFAATASPGTTATNLHFEYDSGDQPGGQFPSGLNVNVSNSVNSLTQTSSPQNLPVIITADNSVAGAGSIVLRLVSSETASGTGGAMAGTPWQMVTVNYSFSDAVPALQWSSYSSTAGVIVGGTVSTNLNLQNNGLAVASNTTIQILNPDGTVAPNWVSLGNSATTNGTSSLGDLAVGASIPVSVNFNPPSSQPLNDYTFIVRASGPNQPNQDSYIGLTVCSSLTQTGSALFHAADIYTGTTDVDGNLVQGLSGATVIIQNNQVPNKTYTLVTDSNGTADFSGIPTGSYQYQASASGHDSTDGTIYVQPGATTTQRVNLQNDLVSVTWQVVPTTIQDRYDVVLNTTFQTQVPGAVVTASPGVINLPALQAGDVFNAQVTLTNNGLIEADGLTYTLPPNDNYLQYQLSGTIPSTLLPGQSVTIPYRITCVQSFPTVVQTALVTGSGAFVASIGILAVVGPARRRKRYRMITGLFATVGLFVLSVDFHVSGQSRSGNKCDSYITDALVLYSYKCVNNTVYKCSTTVFHSYVVNDCPQKTSPAAALQGQSSGGGGGGGPGGATAGGQLKGYTINLATGNPDCFPPPPTLCPQNKTTHSNVNLANRQFQDEATDLKLKVTGGYAYVRRFYYNNQWHWQDLTDGLTVNPATNGTIASITYAGGSYASADASSDLFVENVTENKISASSTGYKLQTKDGVWKTFDLNGKVLATGYRNLTITQNTYSSSGNIASVQDAAGNTIFNINTAVNNGVVQINSIIDSSKREVDYSYDSSTPPNLTSIKDVVGNTTTYSYNSTGQIISKTDINGNTFTIKYDQYGYITDELDSKGYGWYFSFGYDSSVSQYSAQVTTTTGSVENYTFNSNGVITQYVLNGDTLQSILVSGSTYYITDGNGNATEQEFDQNNNVVKESGPRGVFLTQYEPVYNQITQVTLLDGSINQMTYDANGNQTSYIEAVGTPLQRVTSYSYNSYDQITEKTDPLGNKTDYTYDNQGNLLSEYDPNNLAQQVTYTYDSLGDRLSRKDALGHVTLYTYDSRGRELTQLDALGDTKDITYQGDLIVRSESGKTSNAAGRVSLNSYDQDGRLTSIVRLGNGGQQTQQTTSYDPDGRVVSITNAMGQTQSMTYNNLNEVATDTLPDSTGGTSTISYAYDNNKNLKSVTDSLGIKTLYTYDSSNRIITIDQAAGTAQERFEFLTYDSRNHVTQIMYSDGTHQFTTNYTYDVLGRRTGVSGDREYPLSLSYDADNNLVSTEDGNNHTISRSYDTYNRLTKVDQSGQIINFAYDLVGNLVASTDGNGVIQGYEYDAINRQIAQSIPVTGNLSPAWYSNPSLVLSSRTLSPWNDVVASQDAAGAITRSTYDDFGRQIAHTDSAGLTTTYSFNANDQTTQVNYPPLAGQTQGTQISYNYNPFNTNLLDSVVDRNGNTTSYTYDERFQKTTGTASNGGITQYTYDPLGRLVMQTDALKDVTLWNYDQFDELIQKVDADNSATNPESTYYYYDNYGKLSSQTGADLYPIGYKYDAVGNRLSYTDGKNNKISWTYDALNRPISKTFPDGSQYQYGYDFAGNLNSRTDCLNRTTHYQYNVYNEVSAITYPTNSPVSFQYDTLGRRTQMNDGTGTTSWSWDSSGRETSFGQLGETLNFSYDAESHKVEMAVSGNGNSSWMTQYGYDRSGRLQTLLDSRVSTTTPFTYAYQAQTNWILGRQNADGSAILNQYDDLGRMTSTSAVNSTGSAIDNFSYTYDSVGQKTQENGSNGTRQFTYDSQRQLSQAFKVDSQGNVIPSYNYTYNYDAIGNWTKVISAQGETDFASNDLNQYTAVTGSAVPNPLSLAYDADGNLTSKGDGTSYIYDEENRLVEIDTPYNAIVQTLYSYDGLSHRIETRTFSANSQLMSDTRYLYDGNSIIAELDASGHIARSYTRAGKLLACTDNSGSYSYFYDGQGNISDVSNSSGQVAAHYEYDPYGNLVNKTGSLNQPYQFAGEDYDANTGLVHFTYRFYSPVLGRWLNRDPIGELGGVNTYSYCGNNPVRWKDAHGLSSDPNAINYPEVGVHAALSGQLGALLGALAVAQPELAPGLGLLGLASLVHAGLLFLFCDLSPQDKADLAADVGFGLVGSGLGGLGDGGAGPGEGGGSSSGTSEGNTTSSGSRGSGGDNSNEGGGNGSKDSGGNTPKQEPNEQPPAPQQSTPEGNGTGEQPLGQQPDPANEANNTESRSPSQNSDANTPRSTPTTEEPSSNPQGPPETAAPENQTESNNDQTNTDDNDSVTRTDTEVPPENNAPPTPADNVNMPNCFVAGTLVAVDRGEQKIEQIHVGDRVLSADSKDQKSDTNVDPGNWKTVKLVITQGCEHYDVVTVQSPEWLENNHVQKGGLVYYDCPDIALSGWAQVVDIGKAPPIAHGTGHVVLTTIFHTHGTIWRLLLSKGKPIEVTPGHLIYDETQQAFIHACDLKPGDHVKTHDDSVNLTVISITDEHRQASTYNIEVELDHHYFVGAQQLLVHNTSEADLQNAVDAMDNEGGNQPQGLVEGPSSPLAPGGGLRTSENQGGHTLARHVNQSNSYLSSRLSNSNITSASTFNSRAEAELAVNTAFNANQTKVNNWINAGANGKLAIDAPFSGGTVMYRGGSGPGYPVASGNGVRVVLKGNGSGGYYILTAFPTQ